MKERLFNVYIVKEEKGEFEGVFTSIAEIARYFEMPKKVATDIFNSEYENVPEKFNGIYIIEQYDTEQFCEDIKDFRNNKRKNKNATTLLV